MNFFLAFFGAHGSLVASQHRHQSAVESVWHTYPHTRHVCDSYVNAITVLMLDVTLLMKGNTMSNALHDLLVSYQSRVTPAKKQASNKRKSVKAQRKAVTKSVKVSNEIMHDNYEIQGWAPPANFDVWAERNYSVVFATPNAALDADRSDIVVAYNKYVHDVFAVPFNQSVFDRIVRREYSKQLSGLGDLGLLGYSADDIVDLAVFYAWAERIKSYVRAIGADDETAAHISQALRDFRSDAELSEVAQLEGDGRMVYGHDGRLRKQDNSLAVRHARERIALRAELKASGLLEGFNYVPTAGEVYRQVKHVFREGMREWRSTIEGLTRDGVITESLEFKLSVGDEVANTYFQVTEVDEVSLAREAWLDEVKSRELLPAEAAAAAVTEALYRGYSLEDIRVQMFNSNDREFRTAINNAQQLFAA